VSFPGGNTTQPGTAAAVGAPTSTLFNGLQTVLDPEFHYPNHGVLAAAAGSMPTALASANLPYIPGLRVLARRDAVIFYFSNVAGAADYRAYVVSNNVSYVSTANGQQPRGAVIACAGFRQHSYESATSGGNHQRQLLQTVEVPGLVTGGNYTFVLEATKTPCPYTGMPAHTDATITGENFHSADPVTYTYTGTHYAKFVSANTQITQYGNEILNGQSSASSWASRMTASMGLVVPPNDATFPSDPVAIARSAIAVQMPFFDEKTNAPVIDTGANGVEDNFTNDLVLDPSTYTSNPDYAAGGALVAQAPMGDIPGAWSFWSRYVQTTDNQNGTVNGAYSTKGMLGLQVFQRHGRLYTLFGDSGQDVGGAISFASLKTVPHQLDSTKYIHSMFRVNSEATMRRYWTWTLCGGATSAELQDPTTHAYKIHPIFVETSFDGSAAAVASGTLLYADNPSVGAPQLGAVSAAQAQSSRAKECLSIVQDGSPEYPRNDGQVRTSGLIHAQIHPAGYAKGLIALGNKASDPSSPAPGFRYRLDKNQKVTGPMIEPGDQLSPLTHYDFFVRTDRLVAFINGRQAFCVDLSGHPLTMKYGIITYGDLLYHSSIEWQGIAAPADGSGNPIFASQLYQTNLNEPIAESRAWDIVGQAEMIDIPAQFATFDPSTCFKPATTAIQ